MSTWPILPKQPGLDDLLFGVDQMRRALALRADLHHALVFARRVKHRLALEHIRADGFLAIHIRARLHGRDRVQRVPMVRRTDQHNIQVLLFQHLAVVVVAARLLLRLLPLAGEFRRAFEHVLVHVANGNHLHRRHLDEPPQIALAIPTGAD